MHGLGIAPEDLSAKEKEKALRDVEKRVGSRAIMELEGEELDALVIKRLRKIKKLPKKKPVPAPGASGGIKPLVFPINLDLDPSQPLEDQVDDLRATLERELKNADIPKMLMDFFKNFGGGGSKKKKKKKHDGDREDAPFYS